MDTKNEETKKEVQEVQETPTTQFIEGTITDVYCGGQFGKTTLTFDENVPEFSRINPETGEEIVGRTFNINGQIQRNLRKHPFGDLLWSLFGYICDAGIRTILSGAKVKVKREFKRMGELRYDGTPYSTDCYTFEIVAISKAIPTATQQAVLTFAAQDAKDRKEKNDVNLFNV